MLETLIVARAVLHGRNSQPFSVRPADAPRSAPFGDSMTRAFRTVALKVSRWVGATS